MKDSPPDLLADVTLYASHLGGRKGPTSSEWYGCPCMVSKDRLEGWYCRIVLPSIPGKFVGSQAEPSFIVHDVQAIIKRGERCWPSHSELAAARFDVRRGLVVDESNAAGLLVQSVNEVIAIHARRVNLGLRTRVPTTIWVALYLVSVLSMGAVGYHTGVAEDAGLLQHFPWCSRARLSCYSSRTWIDRRRVCSK